MKNKSIIIDIIDLFSEILFWGYLYHKGEEAGKKAAEAEDNTGVKINLDGRHAVKRKDVLNRLEA